MPREIIVLQVLVSSPNDLAEEREALQEIVQELNATWRLGSGIQLNLLMWENDTRPALASDAQAAINAQLGDDYDIFIGMMGSRFGTPTGRAESGTEEEFERARVRFEQNPDNVSVLFYFKDSPPASLSDIDPKQLERVQGFRKKLESLGLIRVFKSREEFLRLMRMHLTHEMQAWKERFPKKEDRHARTEVVPTTTTPPTIEALEDSDEGYLDLLEQGEEGFENLAQLIERIGQAMHEISQRTDEGRAEIDEINAKAQATNSLPDLKAVKRSTNQIAVHLEQFVVRLEAEIPIYSKGFKQAIDPFMTAISMEAKKPTGEALATAIRSTGEMISSHENAITSYREMRDTLAGLPRITTAFNRARRHAVDAVNRLINEFEESLRLSHEFYDFLKGFNDRGPAT